MQCFLSYRLNHKGKGNGIYIVTLEVLHTVLPANYTVTTYTRKRSPDSATADCGDGHLIAAFYSFIDLERMRG